MNRQNKIASRSRVSLCMIVRDEEPVLGRCLESVDGIVDEIIILDTGSTDQTKSVARRFTDKVFDFVWIDDFAAARNHAFSLATGDYIMWLDADDVIMKADREKILGLLPSLTMDIDAVSMYYNLVVDEQGNATSRLRRNRIVRREKQFRWVGAVHEYLHVYGNIVNWDVAVTHSPISHDADRNLRIYEQRLSRGEEFTPRDLYYFANELFDHRLYNRAIEYYQRFLGTKQGWVEDNIAACGKISDCFYHIKDLENQVKYILKAFEYDKPRADFCCRLGYHFLQAGQLQQAVFWYKLATSLELPKDMWGLMNYSAWTWLPHIQLCVCYSRMGEYLLANAHNEKAAEFIPSDPRILQNRTYLQMCINPPKQEGEAVPG